jgi:hypothetical protein
MITVVNKFAHKPVAPTMAKDRFANRPNLLLRFVIAALFFGLVLGAAPARAAAENSAATTLGPGLTFAIADFDGDRHPDFARIEAGQNRPGSSDYSIQIELSDLGRQSIHLVGPAGGLLLEARDVDGDRTIDLVVSAAWRKQPVAIFLNDGHGSFSRAKVAAFPEAFSECKTKFVPASNPAADALGVSRQAGAGNCPEENDSGFDRSPACFILFLSAGFPSDSFLTSHSGRAPPRAVRHS